MEPGLPTPLSSEPNFVLVPKPPEPPASPVAPAAKPTPVPMTRVVIDLATIPGDDLFTAFQTAFGLYRAAGWDSWVDCMSSLELPDDGMAKVHAPPGGIVVIELHSVAAFRQRCPADFQELLDHVAFVNERSLESGGNAFLSLSYRA
jgi:hypothetical protein